MAFQCSDLVISSEICSERLTPGRGTGCFSKAIAFVLHNITTFSLEEYLNAQKSPVLLGETYPTVDPKSVHYVIGPAGTIHKLIEHDDTAWGLSEINEPSWPLFNSFPCSIQLNEPFLHIGFINSSGAPNQVQIDQAALLVCCLALELGMGVTENWTLVARDLNGKLDQKEGALWSVPGNLIPQATVCVANKGIDPYSLDSIYTYDTRIAALEDWRLNTVDPALLSLQECCDDNAASIAALETLVENIQTAIDDINFDEIKQQITDLQTGNLALQQRLTIVEGCLLEHDICDPPAIEKIWYRLDYASAIKLVPGSKQWLNLPIKVEDVSPPLVSTGPLWSAWFTECQECGTYKVTGTVRLASSDFCADKVLELYAVINSNEILIGQYEATQGVQSAFVTGSTIFTVPPDPTDVHLTVYTDDDESPHEIDMASVTIECLDGLIVPACACDDCPETV